MKKSYKEYVVYAGTEFIIEWFYNDNEKSQAKKYFDDLDRMQKLDAYEARVKQGEYYEKE